MFSQGNGLLVGGVDADMHTDVAQLSMEGQEEQDEGEAKPPLRDRANQVDSILKEKRGGGWKNMGRGKEGGREGERRGM